MRGCVFYFSIYLCDQGPDGQVTNDGRLFAREEKRARVSCLTLDSQYILMQLKNNTIVPFEIDEGRMPQSSHIPMTFDEHNILGLKNFLSSAMATNNFAYPTRTSESRPLIGQSRSHDYTSTFFTI